MPLKISEQLKSSNPRDYQYPASPGQPKEQWHCEFSKKLISMIEKIEPLLLNGPDNVYVDSHAQIDLTWRQYKQGKSLVISLYESGEAGLLYDGSGEDHEHLLIDLEGLIEWLERKKQ